MSSRVGLISWGEGASLTLAGYPSSDGVTIKISYEVDVFNINQPCTPSLPTGLVKTDSDFIVISVETDLRRLMVVVISIDAYPFLAFSDLTCHLEHTSYKCFLVALCLVIIRRLNLKSVKTRLLHQQVQMPW